MALKPGQEGNAIYNYSGNSNGPTFDGGFDLKVVGDANANTSSYQETPTDPSPSSLSLCRHRE